MEIFTTNIKDEVLKNDYFRKVLFTTSNAQLVVMTLNESEDIGEEIHHLDQYLFFLEGEGKALLNGKEYPITQNSVFVVPAGTLHNFINSDKSKMKLFTIYAPAEHKDGTIHKTKDEAEEAEKK